jgi:MOSC domain-containing protein YiiM
MSGRLIGIVRKAKPYAEPETLEHARVSVEAGVDGDYRGLHSENKVVVLSTEKWRAACAELGRELPWTTRRGNLLVEGVALPNAIGARFTIGPVELEIIDECAPCGRMEQAAEGLRAALTPDWRGGVACDVVEAAQIALGDRVDVI